MFDLLLAIMLTYMVIFSQSVSSYELEINSKMAELYEINSVLWAEGENTTARLKDLKRSKKCK